MLLYIINIGEQVLTDPSDPNSGLSQITSYQTLGGLINLFVYNLFILAGLVFFFLLIGAGFSIISADSAKGVDDGKKKLTTAIIGLIVMFSAFWIVQIVEFVTGVDIF